MQKQDMSTEEIIRLIKESQKTTPVRVWVSGRLEGLDWGDAKYVGGAEFGVLFGDGEAVRQRVFFGCANLRRYRPRKRL